MDEENRVVKAGSQILVTSVSSLLPVGGHNFPYLHQGMAPEWALPEGIRKCRNGLLPSVVCLVTPSLTLHAKMALWSAGLNLSTPFGRTRFSSSQRNSWFSSVLRKMEHNDLPSLCGGL